MPTAYRLVSTPLGWCSFAISEKGLCSVDTPQRSEAAARRRASERTPGAVEDPTLAPAFASQLCDYFDGRPIVFELPLDFGSATPFQRRVWEACAAVGYGETASYGDLAEAVGKPQAARAVGMAMKRNRLPIVVPCHRICRTDGSIGGYSGTGGLTLKRVLLAMEAGAAGHAEPRRAGVAS